MRLTSTESNILEISDLCVPQAGNSIKRPKLRGLKWSLFGNFNHRFVNRMLLHNINIYFSSAKGQIWLVNHESIVPARIHNQMIHILLGQNHFITFDRQEKEQKNISETHCQNLNHIIYLVYNEHFHEKNKALFQVNFPKPYCRVHTLEIFNSSSLILEIPNYFSIIGYDETTICTHSVLTKLRIHSL